MSVKTILAIAFLWLGAPLSLFGQGGSELAEVSTAGSTESLVWDVGRFEFETGISWVTVRLETEPGAVYTLQSSTDLSRDSWSAIQSFSGVTDDLYLALFEADPEQGTSSSDDEESPSASDAPEVPLRIPSDRGSKRFYRIARTYPDSDGDGLSDRDEIAFGLGNPFEADSDNNGIDDGQEDSDNDGTNDVEELSNGTNPNDASEGGTVDFGIQNPSFSELPENFSWSLGSFRYVETVLNLDGFYHFPESEIEGWSAVKGSKIELHEIKFEGMEEPQIFAELQGDVDSTAEGKVSRGVMQKFKMLPGSTLSYLVWSVGREVSGSGSANLEYKIEITGAELEIDSDYSPANPRESQFNLLTITTPPADSTAAIDVTIEITNIGSKTIGTRIALLPVEVEEEIFMFSGHLGDVVHLKIGGNLDIPNLEWRLKSGDATVGVFTNETTTDAEFKSLKPAKDEIELVIDGNVAWSAPVEVLDIILRASWGAEPAKSGITGAGTTPGDALTFHHSSNKKSGAAEVRRIQDLHMSNFPYNLPFSGGNGWDDIAYHAVIDKNGDVYEGRRLETRPGKPTPGPYTKGAHTGGANTLAGIGICMLGDYEGTEGNESFTAIKQKHLEKNLIATCRRYDIDRGKVSYHRAVQIAKGVPNPSKHCSGSNAIAKFPDVLKNITNNLRYDE